MTTSPRVIDPVDVSDFDIDVIIERDIDSALLIELDIVDFAPLIELDIIDFTSDSVLELDIVDFVIIFITSLLEQASCSTCKMNDYS